MKKKRTMKRRKQWQKESEEKRRKGKGRNEGTKGGKKNRERLVG